MAQQANLPKEDRPDIRPDIPELHDREKNAGGTSSGGGNLGKKGAGGQSGGSTSSAGNLGGTSGNTGSTSRGLYSPGDLKSDEENPGSGYYNPTMGRGAKNGNNRSRFSKRNKIIAAVMTGVVTATVGLSTFFFMGIFNLPNFVKNIEQAGFQRYQVDINGRSTKWLQAYMELRFSEVDDFDHPNQAPGDKDNVFFRANRVDTNKPLSDWYRTLRASNFERNLFESKGIKFSSYAYKENGIIKFRTGIISFPDGEVRFNPKSLGYADLDALEKGDINKFNGNLNDTFNFTEHVNDKEARAAIKEIVNANDPGWWKAIKRYHVRQDIQNMIGVRKWKFFENKRNALGEKKIAFRNKIITQALPDQSKSGDFIKCLFGVSECKASSDPGNQNADDHSATGKQRDGDKTDGNPDNPQPLGDGSAEEILTGASRAGDIAGKILSKLIGKANTLSMLDALSRFDKSMHDGSLSKIITQVKTQQAIGYFTVFEVAADQLTTGQQNASEVNGFMQQFQHGTNNEGWTKVIDPQSGGGGSVSAATTDYVMAKDKAEFCSDKHQAEMKAHPKQAEDEYQWSCAKNKIGAAGNAKALEDEWNGGIGLALHPFLEKFHQATGGIFDFFNQLTSYVTDPVISAALSVTGTQDDVNHLAAAGAAKAIELGGADNMGVTEDSPSGQLAMVALQGSAAQGEASMRDQGAASTTPESRSLADQNVMAYEAEQRGSSTFYARYLSPSNPKSLFATEFFAITTNFDNVGRNFLGVFASALSNPLKALTQPAHAAVPDGYGASRFAGIETFDMPKECLNSQPLTMTPQSVTNADNLGIFKPDELNWDLVNNREDWYKALYDKVGGDEDKAKKVWNCALFDNTVRGGMSARYGYPGENALKSQGKDTPAADTPPSGTVSGDAQELAQEILDNKNIDISASNYCRYCLEDIQNTAQGKHAYGDVDININILKFLADLGNHAHVDINSITGAGSGHSTGSNHYSGNAVDFGCPVDPIADSIAKKYGLMAQNETCGNTDHAHYSKDGF